jgi:hypothetical protein
MQPSGGNDTGTTVVDTVADEVGRIEPDLATVPEIIPETNEPGPTCYEGLQCLIDMKNWQPGMPLDEGECLEGISDTEMGEVDVLLTCVDEQCLTEFEAFENGGTAQLAALYLCEIDNCTEQSSVCIGGQGEDNCSDAVMCLTACGPADMDCIVPCLENTTHEQSVKTGKFLKCIIDDCGGLKQVPECDYPLSCGLKCPELAGG